MVFNVGLIWFTIWSLVAGFSPNYVMLIVSRAMQGLGASAYMPASIMLLGRVYRPGPRKNFVFSVYGAICPIGFFFGIFMGGLCYDMLSWKWYFYIGSILSVITCIISLLTIPRDYASSRAMGISMDWLGTATLAPGMLLMVYAITDSSQAARGWSTPHILVALILGILFLLLGFYVEKYVAMSPLVPGDVFSAKYMGRVILCLFLIYGVFGQYLFYTNF
jgi:MFS family permease